MTDIQFIRDMNDALPWLVACKTYKNKFSDNIPEVEIMKNILKSIPGPTLRLYRDWCNYYEDNDDVYHTLDFDTLVEYIRW